jgi:hypothetical protein
LSATSLARWTTSFTIFWPTRCRRPEHLPWRIVANFVMYQIHDLNISEPNQRTGLRRICVPPP